MDKTSQKLKFKFVWQPSNVIYRRATKFLLNIDAPFTSAISIQKTRNAVFSKLKSSWLGIWFRNRHLKSYFLIRKFVLWLWKRGFYIYLFFFVRVINRDLGRPRHLYKLSNFAKKNKIQIFSLNEAEIIEADTPIVFPHSKQYCLSPDSDQYIFPEIVVATIKNAKVYGETNLVMVDDDVICHELHDFMRDYTSEELAGWILIDAKSNSIRWLVEDESSKPISIAATFVDACAANYAHWMTEVLPRIALFCADEQFQDIPIVVNEGLHKNIMESLSFVVGSERQIILLPFGHALDIEQLYMISVTGYVPFGRRDNKLSGHSHGIFSPRAFEQLRDTMNENIREMENEDWPEKIFLRRNSGVRKLVNSEEIETLLVADGFVIVEPEKLTFLQQLQLFKHAKTIVSSTGAALASAVFCIPKTKVIVIMSIHEDMIYRYWYNMLHPLNINVGYVLGHTINSDQEMHSDFIVNTADVLSILKVMED